jgi:hypothetical protein
MRGTFRKLIEAQRSVPAGNRRGTDAAAVQTAGGYRLFR